MSHKIIHGDNVEAMREMGNECFEMFCTSPPYDDARKGAYETMSWFQFEQVARQIHRLLVSGGVLCWNVKDMIVDGSETLTASKQKIFFAEECGFRVRTLIYQKRNFSHPQKAFYHSVFEYVFVCSKGKPRVFNPLMDRKNITAGYIGNLGVNTFTKRDGSKSERPKKLKTDFGMRHDVWLGNTRGQEDMCEKLPHPAMMPKWLARDLILSWTNPSDTVGDPFGGSGTTAQMATTFGREAVSIDCNPEYVALMRGERSQQPQLV